MEIREAENSSEATGFLFACDDLVDRLGEEIQSTRKADPRFVSSLHSYSLKSSEGPDGASSNKDFDGNCSKGEGQTKGRLLKCARMHGFVDPVPRP